MPTSTPITVAYGDGIGPEIMATALHILQEPGALLDIETIGVGEKVYLSAVDRVVSLGLEVAMTENPRDYDGKSVLTLAQGQ